MTVSACARLRSSAALMGQQKAFTFKGNGRAGRHGWLRLTPAYSVNTVAQLLCAATPSDRILDPFSGTGTTPLVCATMGLSGHAVDINPFLVWLGNLKLTRFRHGTTEDLPAAASALQAKALRTEASANHWRPSIHQIEKWWDQPTLRRLASIYAQIERAGHPGAHLRNLLKLAFCRAMINSANVSFGHQSMSFRRGGQHEGLFSPPDPGALFVDAARGIADSLLEPLLREDCRVLAGDARRLEDCLPGKDYTIVITSPPYPNRMSYIRELRPYMYWLGFLTNGREAGELDWQAIGGTWGCATSQLNSWQPRNASIPYKGFERIVAEINAVSPLLGNYVRKYFEDMQAHLASLRKVLASGAHCYYVIGNSKFYDTLLPTEKIFAALLESLKFKEVGVHTLRKRTSKKELYEYVVEAVSP